MKIITKSNHKAKNPVSDMEKCWESMDLRGYIRQWQRTAGGTDGTKKSRAR